MPAGFREKISCALTGILTHPIGQVSACTTPLTIETRMLCYIAGLHKPSIPDQASVPCQQVPKAS